LIVKIDKIHFKVTKLIKRFVKIIQNNPENKKELKKINEKFKDLLVRFTTCEIPFVFVTINYNLFATRNFKQWLLEKCGKLIYIFYKNKAPFLYILLANYLIDDDQIELLEEDLIILEGYKNNEAMRLRQFSVIFSVFNSMFYEKLSKFREPKLLAKVKKWITLETDYLLNTKKEKFEKMLQNEKYFAFDMDEFEGFIYFLEKKLTHKILNSLKDRKIITEFVTNTLIPLSYKLFKNFEENIIILENMNIILELRHLTNFNYAAWVLSLCYKSYTSSSHTVNLSCDMIKKKRTDIRNIKNTVNFLKKGWSEIREDKNMKPLYNFLCEILAAKNIELEEEYEIEYEEEACEILDDNDIEAEEEKEACEILNINDKEEEKKNDFIQILEDISDWEEEAEKKNDSTQVYEDISDWEEEAEPVTKKSRFANETLKKDDVQEKKNFYSTLLLYSLINE